MEEVPAHVHPGPIVTDVLSRQHEHRSGLIWSEDWETCYTDLQCRHFGRNLFQCYSAAPRRLVEIIDGTGLGGVFRCEHKVTTYNPREGIYMVKSPIRVSGTGNNVYTLRQNNKFCSCGKWQTYTLPCSHVLAVCRENGSRTDAYVPEIYSRQTYIKTYQVNFHPVLSENFWRDVPFNLTFYPPNMKKEQEIRILPQDVVDVACWDIIGKIVITPDQAMYKFDIFLK
ncbi:hypothetical protein M9H77_03012 [Catharanthus roseus]|uniref:Uncharacterized protein n=1 Tax=Catharanthus roseus TaxID=4058 RepID=A0ACC0C9Z7_CATRO|nr:hypothetical protein M9H77_03012 [Catharanthus roseus]